MCIFHHISTSFFRAKQYSAMICKESISQCLLLCLLTNNVQLRMICVIILEKSRLPVLVDLCLPPKSLNDSRAYKKTKYFDSQNSIDTHIAHSYTVFIVVRCCSGFDFLFFFIFHFKIFPLFCIEWNRFVSVHRIFATLIIIVEYIFICFHFGSACC